MNYWKVILATVVIFGAGVLTGGLLVDITQRDLFAALWHRSSASANASQAVSTTNTVADGRAVEVATPHTSDFLNHRLGLLEKMDTTLKLTPAQHNAIEKLIADGQGEINKVMQDTFQNVRDELTPQQQKKYEEMFKQFRSQYHSTSSGMTNHVTTPSRLPVGSPTATNALVI